MKTYASAIARRLEEVVVEIKRPIVDVRRPRISSIAALNGVVVINVEAERNVDVIETAQTIVQLQCDAVLVVLRDIKGTTGESEVANSSALNLVETNTARNVYED